MTEVNALWIVKLVWSDEEDEALFPPLCIQVREVPEKKDFENNDTRQGVRISVKSGAVAALMLVVFAEMSRTEVKSMGDIAHLIPEY